MPAGLLVSVPKLPTHQSFPVQSMWLRVEEGGLSPASSCLLQGSNLDVENHSDDTLFTSF